MLVPKIILDVLDVCKDLLCIRSCWNIILKVVKLNLLLCRFMFSGDGKILQSEGEVSKLKEGGEQAREHIATLHTSLSKVKILQPPCKLMKLVTKLPQTAKLCYIREHTHESTGAEQAALAQHWKCSAWNNFGHEMNFCSSHCKNWSLMMEIFSPWSFGCSVFGEHCWKCVEHMLHCLVAEWRRLETATWRQQPMEVRTTIPVLIVPPCHICLFGFAICIDTDSSTLQIYGEGHRGVWASTSPPHTRPCGEAALCTSILPLLIKGNRSWCLCSCVALHTKAPKLVMLEPCVCISLYWMA